MSTFMNDSFSTIIWGWQIANQVMADGGDPFDQATLNEAMGSLGSYHFLGRPPVDCAGAPEEYQSICYRDATYLRVERVGVHHRSRRWVRTTSTSPS